MKSLLAAIQLVLTLNCEQSARLVSESFDRRLSPAERMAVFCHHRICRSSRQLAAQLRQLEETLRTAKEPVQADADRMRLDEEARQRILNVIRRHHSGN